MSSRGIAGAAGEALGDGGCKAHNPIGVPTCINDVSFRRGGAAVDDTVEFVTENVGDEVTAVVTVELDAADEVERRLELLPLDVPADMVP